MVIENRAMRRAQRARDGYTDNVLTQGFAVVPTNEQHIADALEWMRLRGMPELPRDVFSSTGFVVPGLAALWLYFTNSSLATLEMLVSNPRAAKPDRRAALDAVLDRAIAEAKQSGVRLLSANVQRRDVAAFASRHGLKATSTATVLTMNLQQEIES